MHPLSYAYWAWFSQPKGDRGLYRSIRRGRWTRIVEIGIGSLERTTRLIRVAQRYSPGQTIQYTGVDLFDARPAGVASLPLKTAHRWLKATDARARLAPGPVDAVLAHWANTLSGTDLLLIGAEVDQDSLPAAWFYVPRMLYPGSLVLREDRASGAPVWKTLTICEIEAAAKAKATLRRAA